MAFGIKKLFKKSAQSSQKDSATQKDSAVPDSSETIKEAVSEKREAKNDKIVKLNKSKTSIKEEIKMTTDKEISAKITHEYVEVAADLLAKPQALCDLVEAQGGKAVLVFCNNPSDTDFVEVILKKRGINAVKLIGFVAPEKLQKTQERVKSAELAAVVVTDVAARGLDFSLFPVIVNYSLPSDSDAYNSRTAATQAGERTAVSIVSPLDFANFHTIKSAFEFTKREPPSKEDLAKAKLSKVKNSAQAKGAALDPALSELAKQIAKDGEANSIIAYLLQNLFETVPQLQAQVDKLSWERENLDQDDGMGQEGQPFRQGRGERGNDRGGDRGSDRGGDRGDSRGNRGGRSQQGRRGGYDEGRGNDRDAGRGRRREDSDSQEFDNQGGRYNDRQDSGERQERRPREDRRPPPPQKIRDDRLYIGQGEKDGLSEDQFASILKDQCGVEKDQLKRFLLRKNYAFADLPEGLGEEVVKKLDGFESKIGALYVAKATQVVTVIENEAPPAEAEGQAEGSEENFEGEEQPAV